MGTPFPSQVIDPAGGLLESLLQESPGFLGDTAGERKGPASR
jgi:hypothetical protein